MYVILIRVSRQERMSFMITPFKVASSVFNSITRISDSSNSYQPWHSRLKINCLLGASSPFKSEQRPPPHRQGVPPQRLQRPVLRGPQKQVSSGLVVFFLFFGGLVKG